MAKFDRVVNRMENYNGYTGNPPSNETEYNAMKTEMFDGTAPTWTEVKTAMDNYIDPRESAKAKLIAGEALTEDEANTIVL